MKKVTKGKGIDPSILKILEKNNQGIKLDLGCGAMKNPGFVGMDYRKMEGVDIAHDLEVFPYPLPNESCSMVVSSHVLEHINPHGYIFIRLMNEVWRIMKPGAEFLIAVPYAGSPGYWQDPSHCNGINEVTFDYFDPKGTASNGLLYGIYRPYPWLLKINTWHDQGNLEVVLVKRKIDKEYKVDEETWGKLY
jgi:SAM-dependent methyltransferase